MKLLVSGAFVLSVLTITGCRYISRQCHSSNGASVSCDTLGNQLYFGFYNIDVNNPKTSNVNVPQGACVAYSPPNMDVKFRLARSSAIVAAVLGGFSVLFIFSTRLCLFGWGNMVITGTIIMLACLFQCLTVLMLESSFCTSSSSNSIVSCKFDVTAYESLAGAAAYFVSFIACYSLIPASRKIEKDVMQEDEYDMDETMDPMYEVGKGP